MDYRQALQGVWRVTALEVDGAPAPEAAFAAARIEVAGDRFESRGMGAVYRGAFTADANTFSLTFAEGPEAGSVNHALYELSGDVWRFCIDMAGGPAPADFSTAPGSRRALQTLARVLEQ